MVLFFHSQRQIKAFTLFDSSPEFIFLFADLKSDGIVPVARRILPRTFEGSGISPIQNQPDGFEKAVSLQQFILQRIYPERILGNHLPHISIRITRNKFPQVGKSYQ